MWTAAMNLVLCAAAATVGMLFRTEGGPWAGVLRWVLVFAGIGAVAFIGYWIENCMRQIHDDKEELLDEMKRISNLLEMMVFSKRQ